MSTADPGERHGPSLERAAALSDGVFAIAITLLVLDVREGEGDDLAGRLLGGGPHYLGFTLSFLVIGMMWLNHHRLLQRVHRLGTVALLANLALLAAVSFLPFPTRVLAEHAFDGDADATTATAFYAAACLLVSGCFFAVTEAIRRDGGSHRHAGNAGELRRFQWRGWSAPAGYGIAVGLSFLSPLLTLPVFVILPLLFAAGPADGRSMTAGPAARAGGAQSD